MDSMMIKNNTKQFMGVVGRGVQPRQRNLNVRHVSSATRRDMLTATVRLRAMRATKKSTGRQRKSHHDTGGTFRR